MKTFAQIAPKWNAFIEKHKHTFVHSWDGLSIDISDAYRCVVAEAHKGQRYWKTCETCNLFSDRFIGVKGLELENLQRQFVAHWNKEHPKK